MRSFVVKQTQNTMQHTIQDVQRLANQLLNQLFEVRDVNDKLHWLSAKELGYSFKWTNAKRQFGVCSRKRGRLTIGLSKPLCQLNLDKLDTQIKDVILHELAHAFAYELYGRKAWNHGWLWKHTAVEVGADPNTYYDAESVEAVPAKYTVFCPNGHEHPRHKRPTKLAGRSCGKCSRSYNPAYSLSYRQNF